MDKGGEHRVLLLLMNRGFCCYMYANEETMMRAAEVEVKRFLHFTPCQLHRDKTICYVPGFLTDLVNAKLKIWIENAFQAKTMAMEHEYVIERHGLVPVDFSCTGVVENFMHWSDGLQQFLEMKHGRKLSDMKVITNYMSNVGLLQMYGDQIYGMSGTLGKQTETEALQKIYTKIKTCQIPSFKRRKLFEVKGAIAYDEKQWIKKICNAITAQINLTEYRDQRAVLVICETIKRAKDLEKALGDKAPNKKLYINNNMDNSAIFKEELKAGEVIIATNLAGRGAHFQISEQVNHAGGLFVVQTFLPKNDRVEAQAFGRTARQGFPGCAQLIVCLGHLPDLTRLLVSLRELPFLFSSLLENIDLSCHRERFMMQFWACQRSHRDEESSSLASILRYALTESSDSEMKSAKEVRDHIVAKRLDSYIKCDIPKLKKKTELFNHYLGVQDQLYKRNCNKPADSVLSALKESWGMWLLVKFNENNSIEDLKRRLDADGKSHDKAHKPAPLHLVWQ
ncbi:hypothetical protein LDENG_00066340 [Lucifuga dentata]|nr:hypothetical protein LDENG_00066340 [Lucifuga dentata]